MSEKNKTVELTDEELEKVCGGSSKATGNCGITTMPNSCTQYDSTSEQC